MEPHNHQFKPDHSHPRQMVINSEEFCVHTNCPFTIANIGTLVRRNNLRFSQQHPRHTEPLSDCWECVRLQFKEEL